MGNFFSIGELLEKYMMKHEQKKERIDNNIIYLKR